MLQLVDQTKKQPKGVVEDVLLKVEKFISSVDFVVFNFKKDNNV